MARGDASGAYFLRYESGNSRSYPVSLVLLNPTQSRVSGYMDSISYAPGDSATVYLSASAPGRMRIRLFDAAGEPVDAIDCRVDAQAPSPHEPWSGGFGYKAAFRYRVPPLPSGLYFWDRSIPFVIREPSGAEGIAVVYPSNTINAYTISGGKSLYKAALPESGRAYVLSFQRPQADDGYSLPFFAWMRKLALPARAGYLSDRDLDKYENFGNARLLIIAGHSEYWTRRARRNFDRFIASGKTALVLSGNTMWWQVRYDESGTRMICYKDPVLDRSAPDSLKTLVWATASLGYPIIGSIGSDFGKGGYGGPSSGSWGGYKILRPGSPLFKGTDLRLGEVLALPTREYDGAPLAGLDANGFPLPDSLALGKAKLEIAAFDAAFREKRGYGMLTVFRPDPASGFVINAGSTDWCSSNGISGRDSSRIRRITLNAIRLSLERKDPFAEP